MEAGFIARSYSLAVLISSSRVICQCLLNEDAATISISGKGDDFCLFRVVPTVRRCLARHSDCHMAV